MKDLTDIVNYLGAGLDKYDLISKKSSRYTYSSIYDSFVKDNKNQSYSSWKDNYGTIDSLLTRHTKNNCYATIIPPEARLAETDISLSISVNDKLSDGIIVDVTYNLGIPEGTKPPQFDTDEKMINLAITLALNKSESRSITTAHLRKPPLPSPLDELNSFSVFGLDLKMPTPEEIVVIEMNALHMGMKGFKKSGVLFLHYEKKLLEEHGIDSSHIPEIPASRALNEHLQSYGEQQLSYIGGMLAGIGGINPNRIPGGEALLALCAIRFPNGVSGIDLIHPDFHELYLGITKSLIEVNHLLSDKYEVDQIFTGFRHIKPQSVLHNEAGRDFVTKHYDVDRVVVKPRKGARGRGVQIHSMVDFKELIPKGERYVVEPFIPSIPIYNEATGGFHDGCMRYAVILEERKDGNIVLHDFGAYWRLCPEPLINKWGNWGYNGGKTAKANLSVGAHAIPMETDHYLNAQAHVHNFLPRVYPSMVAPIREKKLEQTANS